MCDVRPADQSNLGCAADKFQRERLGSPMSSIEFPLDVIRELALIREQAEKGVQVLADAETKYVELELAADRAEALAFLNATGAMDIRKHTATLESLEARQAAELARVEVNRVKTKLKQLSEAQMGIQTSARMIELQFKTS